MLKRLPKAVRTAIFGISSPIIVSAALLPLPAWSQADTQQQADRVLELDIPAQSLTNALRALAAQSGLQMVFPTELTAGREAPTIRGQQTPRQALDLMLQGSGLEYEFINERTVMVKRAPASADGAAPDASLDRRSFRVEEVYVTARKREESVQEIPLSITAFSAEDMRVTGVRNVGDMEGVVPGLNMGGGGNGVKKDSNPFIRGVGQRETKVTLDPAVGTYIDGIYLARTAGALLDTVGMERVEVLRGPQGTLFGKNVAGGAISFTTVKPHEVLGGSVSVNVGNYGRSDAAAMLNLPITDTLFSRFTLSSKNSDGYFTNVVDNEKWGDDNRFTGIGQLRWLATDNLTFDLFAERTRIRETPRPLKCVEARKLTPRRVEKTAEQGYNPAFPPGTPLYNLINTVNNPDFDFWPNTISAIDLTRAGGEIIGGAAHQADIDTFSDFCAQSEELSTDKFASDFAKGNDLLDKGRYWVDTATIGLTATWDIGDIGPLSDTTLKSISSWRRVEQIADEDLDGVAQPYLLRVQDGFNKTEQVSQEFQLTGSALNERMFFSTGLYYFQEETPQDVLIRTAGIAQGPAETGSSYAGSTVLLALEPTKETLETENEAYAWYGQVDFELTPQVELSVGLRYTYEKRWSAYTKAYATAPSMVTGDPWNGDWSAGIDYAQTSANTIQPGFASIWDWVFYSEQYPGTDLDGNLIPIPGYEDRVVSGTAYGRKDDSTSNSSWTPMASIKYHFSDSGILSGLSVDEAMAYFTYSQSFTSGGVTPGAVDLTNESGLLRIEDPISFEPQYVDNYEVGLKLRAFDRRVQMNMAAFYTDYTDMQVTSTANRLGMPIPFVDNVGKAVIQGFEGEFIFTPTSNWRVIANVAYTDADLKEWDARQVLLQPITGVPLHQYTFTDRSDEPMPRVPRWQGFFLTDYTFELPDGALLTPSIAARYMSEIYHGFDRGSYIYAKDKVTSEPVTFVDARLSYLSADGKVELSLWGKNLTNKQDHMVSAISLVDVNGSVGQVFTDPRTFGLEMTYNFGGI